MLKFELIEDFTKLKAGDPVYFGKGGTPYKFLAVFEEKVWVINGHNKAESTVDRNDWFRGIEVTVNESYLNLYKGPSFFHYPTKREADSNATDARQGVVRITYHDGKPVKVELVSA